MPNREPIQDSDTVHCIKSCLSCQQMCLETLHYCLSQKMTHFQGRHIAILQLCADSCDLAAKMMIADVSFHRQSCVLAFELSEACAIECERYQEDPQMVRCAEICRVCAESCRGMAGTAIPVKVARAAQTAQMRT